MGFDQALIVAHVDEELLCPICADVLEEPMQSSSCEHSFCRYCIEKWMQEKQICPVDRSVLMPIHLVPVSRLMRNMLGRLKIKCSFAEHGCTALLALEDFRSHVDSCYCNPKVVVTCTKGCGMKVPKNALARHNCVFELRQQLQDQAKAIPELRDMQAILDRRMREQRRELELLQYYIATLRATNPVMRSVGDQLDRYSLMRWAHSLPLGSVFSWGGLISTPDTPMRLMVREGLRAGGCPMHLMEILLECCHENSWPAGINTLDMRRINLHRLTQYVTRLLPVVVTGKPCVVVLSGDNAHMPENLLPALGMVMIFVEGVDEMQSEPAPLPDSDYL